MDIEFLRLDIHSSYNPHTVKHTNIQRSLQTHRPENFKHRSHPFSPPSQTQSLSLLTHSFLSQCSMFNPLIKYKEPSRRKLQLIPMDRKTLRTIGKYSQFNQTLLLNHYLIPIHKLIFFQTFLKHKKKINK